MSELGFLFDGLDAGERLTRLREMRALVAVYCGWNHPAKLALDQAVSGGSLAVALAEIDRLPTGRRRRLLSSYGALTMPGWC
jgi:hypothetical protein